MNVPAQDDVAFTPTQEACLQAIVAAAIRSTRGTPGPVRPSGSQGPQGPHWAPGQATVGATINSWRPDELCFFDPDLQDEYVIGKGDIVYGKPSVLQECLRLH